MVVSRQILTISMRMVFQSMTIIQVHTVILPLCSRASCCFVRLLTVPRLLAVAHTVVVYPETTEDVVRVVKIANKYRMPIVPYSGATSLEGHFRGAQKGSICVNLSHMNKILAIHGASTSCDPLVCPSNSLAEDGDLVCQPGTPRLHINDTLVEMGMFICP
jgi:FAD/FMN-containing dehydrogenase